jgi:hypothetical protein
VAFCESDFEIENESVQDALIGNSQVELIGETVGIDLERF